MADQEQVTPNVDILNLINDIRKLTDAIKEQAVSISGDTSRLQTIDPVQKNLNIPSILQRWAEKNINAPSKEASVSTNAGRIFAQSAAENLGRKDFLKNTLFSAFGRTAAVGSSLGATIATGGTLLAILGVLKAIQITADQIGKIMAENLSYDRLAANALTARNAEARLGNFEFGANRGTNVVTYSNFRNLARRMGMRDDAELTRVVNELAGAGIGGRTGKLEDLYQGALSKIAASKVLGVDFTAEMLKTIYRGSQGNFGIFAGSSGEFDVSKFAQRFAYAASASTNEFGVRVSTNEWFKIFKEQTQTLRGVNQDYTVLQRNMVGFSDMLARNEATGQNLSELYNIGSRMSDQSIFRTLAFAGVSGGDLLKQKELFIQRGFTAQGKVQNARELLRSMLGFESMTGGDEWTQRHLLRKQLNDLGLSSIARMPDPMEFLKRVEMGDKSALNKYDQALKEEKDVLTETAQKLDTIANPVTQIRDVLFGLLLKVDWFSGGLAALADKGAQVADWLGSRDVGTYVENLAKAQKQDNTHDYTTVLEAIRDNTQQKQVVAVNTQNTVGSPD